MRLADVVALMFWRPRQAAAEARQNVIAEEVAYATQRLREAVAKHNRVVADQVDATLHRETADEARH
jgi:F0F1-type ATP synthase membrane subunit b/b'